MNEIKNYKYIIELQDKHIIQLKEEIQELKNKLKEKQEKQEKQEKKEKKQKPVNIIEPFIISIENKSHFIEF